MGLVLQAHHTLVLAFLSIENAQAMHLDNAAGRENQVQACSTLIRYAHERHGDTPLPDCVLGTRSTTTPCHSEYIRNAWTIASMM